MVQPMFLMMRWLQTVPLALLAFEAFRDGELRASRRACRLSSAGYMALASAVLAAFCGTLNPEGQRDILLRDMSLALALGVYFAGWAWAVRASAPRKLLAAGALLHWGAVLQAGANVLAALLLREDYASEVAAASGSLAFNLCLLAVTAAAWPLMRLFFRRVLAPWRPAPNRRETFQGLALLWGLLVLFTLAVYNPRYDFIPETPLFVATLLGTNVVAYYTFFQRGARFQSQCLYDQPGALEELRRLKHDLRHHLNTLGALNAQGRQAEITDYLRRYGEVWERLEGPGLSGDPAVDSILAYYQARAREDGVPMECRAALPRGCVEAGDMTVLLGNCLENALEAQKELPAEKRWLRVEIQPAGRMLRLLIQNACGGGEASGDFRSFPSRKRHGRQGVGLQSVSGVAEKYHGCADFRRSNGVFTVRIALAFRVSSPCQ